MKMRTIVLASVAVFVISGSGAFTTTRYLVKSLGLKAYPTKVANGLAASDTPQWSQADAARALKISNVD